MTAKQLLDSTQPVIRRRDAETLLLHLLGHDRAWLLAHGGDEIDARLADRFRALIQRRSRHEPLQYLTGRQEFFGLPLRVDPRVLIPRPETELLVEAVAAWVQVGAATRDGLPGHGQPWRVVDVGTGSGAIALALAHTLQTARICAEVYAVDRSADALRVAETNARDLGLQTAVTFAESDLLDVFARTEDVPGTWDVVVSNPPYVPAPDAATLQPEVRDFEPHSALFAGQDGLDVYRRLIPQASWHLRPGGLLALEFGFGQHTALQDLLQGWEHIQILNDYAGIPRIALAVRPMG